MLRALTCMGVFCMSILSYAHEKQLHYDLISAKKNQNVGDWSISSQQLNMDHKTPWSIRKSKLHGGLQEGVEIIEVDNGELIITIVPTRGMNVLRVDSGDLTLGWDSPVKEVVHPSFVNLDYNGGLGWLDSFNEWMVRCGIEYSGHPGEDQGRNLTLHGRIAHIPASEVSVEVEMTSPPTLKVKGLVQERWFKGAQYVLETTLSTVVGSNSFQFDDTITNEASDEKEFQILYHANFAKQLLEEGSKLHGTMKSVQPFNADAAKGLDGFETYGPPAKELAGESVYQIIPRPDSDGHAHFLLKNAAGDKAVSFEYPVKNLPYFTMWKNEDSLKNGYVTGLEPGNSFPANRSHERKKGRIQKLKGGASVQYQLKYTLHKNKASVSEAVDKIEQLNEGHSLNYIRKPEH